MNISVKGEYALKALFDLSLQRTTEPVKIADIARRQKIPQKFLELILAGLKQAAWWNRGAGPKAATCWRVRRRPSTSATCCA